jgi:hypothetical protein
VWPRNSWRIRFAKVKIKIGKAFYAADIVGEKHGEYTDADYAKVTDHLERTIAEMIEELR